MGQGSGRDVAVVEVAEVAVVMPVVVIVVPMVEPPTSVALVASAPGYRVTT
jgi:hypothetical protein